MYDLLIHVPTTQPEAWEILKAHAVAGSLIVTMGPPGAAAAVKAGLMMAPTLLHHGLTVGMKVRPVAWVLRNVEPNVKACCDAIKAVYDKDVEPEGDGTPAADPKPETPTEPPKPQ